MDEQEKAEEKAKLNITSKIWYRDNEISKLNSFILQENSKHNSNDEIILEKEKKRDYYFKGIKEL